MIPRVPIGHWMTALLLAATLSACDGAAGPTGAPSSSSSSSSFDATAAHDDLAALYAGDHPSTQDRRDGDCFATRFLNTTTPGQLARAGVLDEHGRVVAELPPLDAATAQDWADAQFACVDFVDASTRSVALAVRPHRKLDTAAYGDCLRAALTQGQMEAAVVASLRGRLEDPAVGRLARAQADCVSS